ncbi:uncharacterized protein LY89DRAFT_384897 [Mollisia scopiformis]|uniref:Uncharacterized protein n=1 Tax=Mollisia scopiformis TaxID=149040 RepID=A0A194XNQ8_MOLSC|nr:uncharacterized protein LY89DRAFT_384897 [Mollisia scopiformis]KUJ21808.1 hypothetical protein LY89DRAFT_384897 [Mollisia scopiformis]
MAATIEELEGLFDDHPSLDASLQDFEPTSSEIGHSPRFGYPSHHSGFRSDSESEMADSVSGGRYSPPAWRRLDENGNRSSGFWNKRPTALGKRSRDSRESSPEYESADEGDDTLAAAARVRLPTGSLSPEKRRSPSPDPYPAGDKDFGNTFGSMIKHEEQEHAIDPSVENKNNFIRFALRAEVQHRTEPFEATFSYFRTKFDRMTKSWTSLFISLIIGMLSMVAFRSLIQPGLPSPVPDLVKVAGLAKAFEPLIFYSENGVQQIGDLQATGVAVWDLGESVRTTNMTSAPIIVKELDDLSESLKTLAIELTRFFANVDGDVDGILIVMDWARRELSQLQLTPPSPVTSAYDNVHTLLSRFGLLETPSGTPTRAGALATSIFGVTSQQRTRQTLQRTFTEFLSVLEESINSELQHSLALFSLFEAIDRQFGNLARTVARESDAQDSAQDDLLSSLWTKLLGADAGRLHKYEKNKKLLSNIRAKTVQNKNILEDHNRKLLMLKANLEHLRRKLVSPLVRANGSTLGVQEQIRGLEEVSGYLGGVREKQKSKLMEYLYGSGSQGRRIGSVERSEIEGRWDR